MHFLYTFLLYKYKGKILRGNMGYFRYIESYDRTGVYPAVDSLYSVPITGGISPLQMSGMSMPPIFTLSNTTTSIRTSSLGTPTLGSISTSSATSSQSMSSVDIPPIDENCELKPGLFKGRLAGQEALVVKICKKYGVSPALVTSIICEESGYGTSKKAYNNNFMGYRAAGDLGIDSGGFGKFSTIEKGLEAGISNLARYTRFSDVSSVDFNNLDAIGRHYCEGNVWASHVRNVYNTVVSKYIA